MTNFEEFVRNTMRAHDVDAPTSGDFDFRRPADLVTRSRSRIAALAAAVCVLTVVAIIVGISASHRRDDAAIRTTLPTPVVAALACPAKPPVLTSPTNPYPLPGPRADTLDTSNALVPTAIPLHVTVCAYVHPTANVLTGSRLVDGGRAAIPDLLGLSPRQPGEQACMSDLRITDGDLYLVGLTYANGTMWISAPDDHCLGASNGHFITSTHVAAAAITAYRTGSWTPTSGGNPCLATAGRLGQEHALVPDTPRSAVVCDNSSGPRTATTTDLLRLRAALNALPAEADQHRFKCGGNGEPTAIYTVVFAYNAGPPVSVYIAKGCAPAIHNGNLEAASAFTVLPIVQQVLAR